jgi:hypothetical protein
MVDGGEVVYLERPPQLTSMAAGAGVPCAPCKGSGAPSEEIQGVIFLPRGSTGHGSETGSGGPPEV